MEIEKLVKQMTLEEKANFLTGAASMETYAVERLGINSVSLADGPHGVRTDLEKEAVLFPNLCCVGSTWDKEMIYKLGEALANECIEHDIDMLLAPGINIKRHILCGRNFEYLSEDPVLSGEISAAYIQGIQSLGVGTSLKHFAANNQEAYRDSINVEIDERVLRELYLKGFEIAVKKASPASVMCAYNKVGSVWCSENRFLLTDVLKREWNYDGFVVSDWGAVQDTCSAIRAGLDLRMPHHEHMLEDILEGIKGGVITETQIDDAVERILSFVMQKRPEKRLYNRNSQHEIAKEIAAAGIVLLKNENNALPLNSKKYRKISVIGDFAQIPLVCGQGSAEVNVKPEYIDSPLEAMIQNLGDVEIQYKDFYKKREFSSTMLWPRIGEFAEFIDDSDAVIMFIGAMESEDTECLDRRDAHFNPNYEMIVNWGCDLGKKHGKKVVVVIQSGSAMILGDWKNKADAIVQMWLGGEAAGSAIAEVLTGNVNPSGKLAETFPTTMRKDLEYPGDGIKITYKEGLDVGYRYYDKHPEEICYPFGHGLSYTQFKYTNLCVKQMEENLDVSFEIENIGDCDGAEVAQIYVGDPVSTVTKPIKELKAFEKIRLKKGELQTVRIGIPIGELAYYNALLRKWIVEDGRYDVYVGSSSRDIRLQGDVCVEGQTPYTLGQQGKSMLG